MNPSKEVIEAAERYWVDTLNMATPKRCANGSYENFESGFIAGDTNGYSRAMERIGRLESLLADVKKHCVCHRNVHGFDYHEEHSKLGKPKSGSRWKTPCDLIDQALKGV